MSGIQDAGGDAVPVLSIAAESNAQTHAPRILIVPNAIFFPPYVEQLKSLAEAGAVPRTWVNELPAKLEFLDARLTTSPPPWRRALYTRLPIWIVQVLEAYRVGRSYDAVFCWGTANIALLLAALLKLTRRRITHIALLTRVSEPKKARLLRRVHSHLTRIILPPVVQREYAMNVLGVPARKLVGLPWTLDTEFWKPVADTPRTTICAAGGEMRDYRTLVAAMKGLDIPCHIAGVLNTARQDWWNANAEDRRGEDETPSNVTFGTMGPKELRTLYARSRIVIVPLRPTDSDNGITCMHEAWAMGCPVIVSAVAGQRDTFLEGELGLWVPPGDAEALRAAIAKLWADPARAQAMGAAGRRFVEMARDHKVFVEGVGRVLAEAVAERK